MIKGVYSFISLFLLTINILAQKDNSHVFFSSFIDSTDLKRKVYILADDSLLGRETAREGQRKAEKFIVSEFKKLGLDAGNNGSYLQNYSVINRALNTIHFKVGENIVTNSEKIISYNSDKNLKLTASSIVFAGYGITSDDYNDYKNISIEDKVVFVLDGTPKDEKGKSVLNDSENRNWIRSSSLKKELAFKNGAKAIVFIMEDFIELLPRYKKYFDRGGVDLYDPENDIMDEFPTILLNDSVFYNLFDSSKEDIAKRLYRFLAGKNVKEMEIIDNISIDIECNKELGSSSNVLAKITTNDSLDPWIVLSAHYDHEGYTSNDVYNGADDNASGTSAVIEIAKAFKIARDSGIVFEKNILFLLVSGEEKGLLGSKYYTLNPVMDLERTMVDLNIDMIGRVDEKHKGNPNYVYVIGADKISQKLHDINEKMNSTYTKLAFDYTYNLESDPNRYYYRSDHYNFAKNGIPVIFYFNGTHEDYHRVSDTADKINYNALYIRTQLVFHTAWYLANMKGVLID